MIRLSKFDDAGSEPIPVSGKYFLWIRDSDSALILQNDSGTKTVVGAGGGISGSGTDNQLARWDGTGALQGSGFSVTDAGDGDLTGKLAVHSTYQASRNDHFQVHGTNASNTEQSAIGLYASADTYPVVHYEAYSHDDSDWMVDAYYDGGYKSSDVGSNFSMYKQGDFWKVRYDSGNNPGDSVTWNEALSINLTTGEAVFGSKVSGPSLPIHAVKTVDEPVTSSTTMQNDDDLFIALEANSYYVATLHMIFEADVTGSLKFDWTVPTGALGFHGNTGNANADAKALATDQLITGRGAGNERMITWKVIVYTAGNAGNLQFRWAQNSSHATATIVEKGSSLTAWKQE